MITQHIKITDYSKNLSFTLGLPASQCHAQSSRLRPLLHQ